MKYGRPRIYSSIEFRDLINEIRIEGLKKGKKLTEREITRIIARCINDNKEVLQFDKIIQI